MEIIHPGLLGLPAPKVVTEVSRLVAVVVRIHRLFTMARIVQTLVLRKRFKSVYSNPVLVRITQIRVLVLK